MVLADHAPVLDDGGSKSIGSAQEIIIHCCLKDQRNAPGQKPQPKKTAEVEAKSLYPKEFKYEIHVLLNWYLTKFKPHSAHLFNEILRGLKFEEQNLAGAKEEIKQKMETTA